MQSVASVQGSCFPFPLLRAIMRIWLHFHCIVKNVPSRASPGPSLTGTCYGIGTGFSVSKFGLLLSKLWRSDVKLPVPLLKNTDFTKRMDLKFSFVWWSLNTWSLQVMKYCWFWVTRKCRCLGYISCSCWVQFGWSFSPEYKRFSCLCGSFKLICSPEWLSGCCCCREELV